MPKNNILQLLPSAVNKSNKLSRKIKESKDLKLKDLWVQDNMRDKSKEKGKNNGNRKYKNLEVAD